MAKTNWEKLQDRDPSEDTRYRDVYEDQQLVLQLFRYLHWFCRGPCIVLLKWVRFT